jgi:hypothetical protein
MSGTPRLKLIDPHGVYVAAFRYAEDAAAVLGIYGDGAKLRFRSTSGPVVWHEGREAQSASESYDFVAKIVDDRIAAYWAARPSLTQGY